MGVLSNAVIKYPMPPHRHLENIVEGAETVKRSGLPLAWGTMQANRESE
jgi:hypothetical protein